MKVIDVKKSDISGHLNSYVIDYQDKDENQKKWMMVSRGDLDRVKSQIFDGKVNNDGVQIVAFNKEKKTVILIREFRVIHNDYLYSFPAGLSEKDESLEVTAIREFHEETGLFLEVNYIEAPRYTSVGITDERTAIAYGQYSGEISKDHLESSEDITVIEADRDKVIELLENEEVTIRTALLLQRMFSIGYCPFCE